MALEARLKRDPIFRAKFEAQVGGKYVPDGRNDGKVTVRRFKPRLSGIHGIGPRTVLGALGRMQSQIADLIGKLGNKNSKGGIQGKEGSYVSKLGPNATFEDLVAAFMKDVMKEQQKEIRGKMKELDALKANHDKKMKGNSSDRGNIVSNITNKLKAFGSKFAQSVLPLVGKAVGSMWGPLGSLAGGAIGSIAGNIVGKRNGGKLTGDKRQEELSKYQDSRQMMMEELKNMMQKLQQMQQALSNVLNSMHQGAMNSIRNIRA